MGWSHIPALKEGEKIKISLAKKPHATTGESGAPSKSAGGGGGFLKPPPPPGSTVHFKGAGDAGDGGDGDDDNKVASIAPAVTVAATAVAEEEEWGDFN